MTSKRGRKRNDNLPPNRARDVQRAFRARRAAHLLALEERVAELHEENIRLRKMVGWPPDDRPPLGRGPTGKDKPKMTDSGDGSYALDFFSSHDSESDSSPRASSLSPSVVASSSRGLHVIDSETWDNTFTMDDPSDPPPESPYQQLQSTETPGSTKSIYPSYGSGLSSSLPSSRSPLASSTTNAYMDSPPTYAHSTDRERHLGDSYSSPSFVGRSAEIRVDSPREHYSYHALPYQDHDTMPSQSPPPPSSVTPSNSQSHTSLHQRHIPVTGPFTHRRAFTEQYSISHGLHLPIPAQMHAHQMRQLDQYRLHGGAIEHRPQQEQQEHAYRSYGPDGRMI
ncbi:hypothetical protein C0992_003305 [Termitomyces sp. T32_za158]|nr:hypothetical protein C0992_003305 [Termitomyces sp. T32_za158]